MITFHICLFLLRSCSTFSYLSEGINDRILKKDMISLPDVLPLSYFFFFILFCLVFPSRGFRHMADDPSLYALFNSGGTLIRSSV